ncbi:MAG: hypothetical protein H6933_08705 [Burkholderiaceae bacterium]|nr:hypothetical protein [Rhodoferax sp.]MCP5284966.1 hypothetical protein [Burkholderiaceae bacterium]
MRSLLLMSALALSGCAGLTSRPLGAASTRPAEGIVYHLPRADIVITVTVEGAGKDAKVTETTIAAGGAYADLRTEYLLNVERNHIGETVIDIGVTQDGLLNSANATSTPKIIEALQFVAEKSAAIGAAAATPDQKKNTCRTEGSHTFLVPVIRDDEPADAGLKFTLKTDNEGKTKTASLTTKICGDALTVRVEDLVPASNLDLRAQAESSDRQGVYYRQSRPFRVTVTPINDGFGLHADQVILSPTRSPLRLLPYARSLFGRGEVALTFVQGQPQTFKQTVDGEIPGLLKLPAAILQAYFAAVGALFNGFSGRDAAEAKAIGSEIQLELAKQKLASCMAAAKKSPPDAALLQSLGCTGSN